MPSCAKSRARTWKAMASAKYTTSRSKEELVTEAAVEGLDRWLRDLTSALGEVGAEAPTARLGRLLLAQPPRKSRSTRRASAAR
jgi:hypothetical protein